MVHALALGPGAAFGIGARAGAEAGAGAQAWGVSWRARGVDGRRRWGAGARTRAGASARLTAVMTAGERGGARGPCGCGRCGMFSTAREVRLGARRVGRRDTWLVHGSGAPQRGQGHEGDGAGQAGGDGLGQLEGGEKGTSRMDAVASAAFLGFIRWYQRNVSPLTPAACRYLPTCSAFGVEAVQRFGPWRGGLLIALRISRCAPWGSPTIAYDPPVWPPPTLLPFVFYDQYADWEPPPDADAEKDADDG